MHGNTAIHHADRILRTPLHFACSRVRDVCILRVATTCGCRSAVLLDVFPFNSAASAAACFVRVMVAVRGSEALGMLRASSPGVTTSSPWSSDASPRPSPGHFPLPRQRLSLVGRFVGSRGARGSVSGALRSSGCLMRIGESSSSPCRGLSAAEWGTARGAMGAWLPRRLSAGRAGRPRERRFRRPAIGQAPGQGRARDAPLAAPLCHRLCFAEGGQAWRLMPAPPVWSNALLSHRHPRSTLGSKRQEKPSPEGLRPAAARRRRS
jgi:hypothetical protein